MPYTIVNSQTWGGFLIRRSSAIRRFIAGILRCDNRTIMKSFLKNIAREFSGNFGGFLCKFPVKSRAIFLRNDFIIVRLSHLRNPAINLRIAELRLMRNPPLIENLCTLFFYIKYLIIMYMINRYRYHLYCKN